MEVSAVSYCSPYITLLPRCKVVASLASHDPHLHPAPAIRLSKVRYSCSQLFDPSLREYLRNIQHRPTSISPNLENPLTQPLFLILKSKRDSQNINTRSSSPAMKGPLYGTNGAKPPAPLFLKSPRYKIDNDYRPTSSSEGIGHYRCEMVPLLRKTARAGLSFLCIKYFG